MDKEENKDTKNEAESPQPDNLNISDEEILKKLQDAYTSINNLKITLQNIQKTFNLIKI